jgi:V/A-type H+-transporting ATPase subunit D
MDITTLPKTKGTVLEIRSKRVRLERAIPTLELKQKQLNFECNRLQADLAKLRQEIKKAVSSIKAQALMLQPEDFLKYIKIAEVSYQSESIAGIKVKSFKDLKFAPVYYSLFYTPPSLDNILEQMKNIKGLMVRLAVMEEAYSILYKELRKVTQRINLFEKKLIPDYSEAEGYLMQRLDDMERHATIIAKVAKSKFFEPSRA